MGRAVKISGECRKYYVCSRMIKHCRYLRGLLVQKKKKLAQLFKDFSVCFFFTREAHVNFASFNRLFSAAMAARKRHGMRAGKW